MSNTPHPYPLRIETTDEVEILFTLVQQERRLMCNTKEEQIVLERLYNKLGNALEYAVQVPE